MTNPQYQIYISYVPMKPAGMVGTYQPVAGASYSVLVSQSMSYTSPYFYAVMPEVKLSATGSSYTTALSNLLLVASASNGNGATPIGL
jgi:hypothetical protein